MTENELRTFLNVSDNYPNDNDELDEFLQREGLNDVANVDNLGDVLGIDPDWMESLTTFHQWRKSQQRRLVLLNHCYRHNR